MLPILPVGIAPKPGYKRKRYKLYCARTLLTDGTITSKIENKTFLIDIAIANDINVLQKEQDAITKYDS